MKGYIYRLYAGSDPAVGWVFNDPIFGSPPTLGACVPNIRRSVEPGDWVFCISGRVDKLQPYVVGGFQVNEKLNALEAHRRFPQYHLTHSERGQVLGNVIVDQNGNQDSLDNHSSFERRVENYLVGGEQIHVSKETSIAKARNETVPILSEVFKKPANRSFDVVPRWRKMDATQISSLSDWLRSLS